MKNPFKQQQEKSSYLIVQYQVIYKDGIKDIVKLNIPIEVDDITLWRKKKIKELNCVGINLTYFEY